MRSQDARRDQRAQIPPRFSASPPNQRTDWRRRTLMTACCGLLLVCGQPTRGDTIAFNINFGTVHPGDSFGAAAGQPGFWNGPGAGATATLRDLNGDLTTMGISPSGLGVFNSSAGSSDFSKLMSTSIYRNTSSTLPWSWSIGGLPNGEYRVYIYDDSLSVIRPGDFTVESLPVTSFNDAAAGFVEGDNYKVVDVEVADGSLDIVQTSGDPPPSGGFGIAGLQIMSMPVPEPTTLALLVAALPLLIGCARGKKGAGL